MAPLRVHAANEIAGKPCYDALEDQTRARVELYRKRVPSGDRIPSRAKRPPLSDTPPTDKER